MKPLLLIAIVVLVGCKHPKDGMTVKASDGNYYRLGPGLASDDYTLELIDTTMINLNIKSAKMDHWVIDSTTSHTHVIDMSYGVKQNNLDESNTPSPYKVGTGSTKPK